VGRPQETKPFGVINETFLSKDENRKNEKWKTSFLAADKTALRKKTTGESRRNERWTA